MAKHLAPANIDTDSRETVAEWNAIARMSRGKHVYVPAYRAGSSYVAGVERGRHENTEVVI